MAFSSPTVCLSLAYSPPLSYETCCHAVHLFSSTVLFNFAVFFHSLPSPPSLCLSVLPTSSTSLRLLLPHEPTSPSMPTRPLPLAASCPLPYLARRVPHECQAGIQGICRCASLTGSAGAATGRLSCPVPLRVTTTKACCADWLVSPPPAPS